MRRHAGIETNRDVLKQIVMLLFSMAAMAAYVSTRPRHVRLGVLPFLRQAELVGWSVALDDAYGLVAPPDLLASISSGSGDSAADAARLAVVLRMLAMTLIMKVGLHCDFADTPGAGNHAARLRRSPGPQARAFALAGLHQIAGRTVNPPVIPP